MFDEILKRDVVHISKDELEKVHDVRFAQWFQEYVARCRDETDPCRLEISHGLGCMARAIINVTSTHDSHGSTSIDLGETYTFALAQKYDEDSSSQLEFDSHAWIEGIGGMTTTRTHVYGFGSQRPTATILNDAATTESVASHNTSTDIRAPCYWKSEVVALVISNNPYLNLRVEVMALRRVPLRRHKVDAHHTSCRDHNCMASRRTRSRHKTDFKN
ncbi:Uncharacterized protein TCM_009553 [Theobroma cacao]|uniref:Uncharacterized protein n=1 Tax=Theobroma cacao TaxID=3641 RepID=A0A061E623_THECC|nr:Uncharacterized protein TCM_009553 [Theobroma cacao]